MKHERTGRILVVDDQEAWREVLSVILEEDGHQVATAATYQEARSILENEHFDVAVLDIRLVDESPYNIEGIALLREIRDLAYTTKVVILTGYSIEGLQVRALEFGADAFLTKVFGDHGFSVDDFSQLIFDLLQN